MNKLAIFDLDGTLLDTIADLADSMNIVLEDFGIEPHSYEIYKKFVGNGIYNLAKRSAGEDKDVKIVDAVYKRFIEVYGIHYMDKTKPYDGIYDVVSSLKKKGVKLAVLSNKKQIYSENLCKKLFPDIFDIVVGDREGMERKPSEVPVEFILNKLDVKKENAFMIGDSDVDVITSKNAGIGSVGCAWGFRGVDELKSAGADYIAYTAKDIEDIISEYFKL